MEHPELQYLREIASGTKKSLKLNIDELLGHYKFYNENKEKFSRDQQVKLQNWFQTEVKEREKSSTLRQLLDLPRPDIGQILPSVPTELDRKITELEKEAKGNADYILKIQKIRDGVLRILDKQVHHTVKEYVTRCFDNDIKIHEDRMMEISKEVARMMTTKKGGSISNEQSEYLKCKKKYLDIKKTLNN